MTMPSTEFGGALDEKTTREEFMSDTQRPDEQWVANLTPIQVGQSFRANRPETENVRTFKKKVNRAAASPPNFKTLEWKTKDVNLPEGIEPSHFVVKIKAMNLKAKAEYEARQNGTVQGAQTTNGQTEGSEATSEETTAVGPRRPR